MVAEDAAGAVAGHELGMRAYDMTTWRTVALMPLQLDHAALACRRGTSLRYENTAWRPRWMRERHGSPVTAPANLVLHNALAVRRKLTGGPLPFRVIDEYGALRMSSR